MRNSFLTAQIDLKTQKFDYKYATQCILSSRKQLDGIRPNDRDDARSEFLAFASTMDQEPVPYPCGDQTTKAGAKQNKEGWRRFASSYAEMKREYTARELVRKKSGADALLPLKQEEMLISINKSSSRYNSKLTVSD